VIIPSARARISGNSFGRRGGNKAHFFQLDGKGDRDAPQEQRDLGRRRTD
jgi:hypothetical protein